MHTAETQEAAPRLEGRCLLTWERSHAVESCPQINAAALGTEAVALGNNNPTLLIERGISLLSVLCERAKQ